MNIAIGADHRGVQAAITIAEALERDGHIVEVAGGGSDEPCDYPDRAYPVGTLIASGRAERGVRICRPGVGMAMAATAQEHGFNLASHDRHFEAIPGLICRIG